MDEKRPEPERKRPVRGEAGESEGSDEASKPEDDEDEQSWESFPASDPPSY
jgi:hypothetical protein